VAVNPDDILDEFGRPPFFKPTPAGETTNPSGIFSDLTTLATTTFVSVTTTSTAADSTSVTTTEPFYDDFVVIEDIHEGDVVSIVAVNDGSGQVSMSYIFFPCCCLSVK
jgi:hypothetical protein